MTLPLVKTSPPNTFAAATLNVYNGTSADAIGACITGQITEHDVRLWYLQEAAGSNQRDIDGVLTALGLETWAFRQWRLAWDPNLWAGLALWPEKLSETPYFAKGSKKASFSYAACGIFADALGRTLTAASYHTPPNVQVKNPPARRLTALYESIQHLGGMSAAALTDDFLAGGDDNVDEKASFVDRWTPIGMRRTGLRQFQAPATTHGARRIDDFRKDQAGALSSLDAWVFPGPGDHSGHGRRWAWKT